MCNQVARRMPIRSCHHRSPWRGWTPLLILAASGLLAGRSWAAEPPQAVLLQLTGKATVISRSGTARPVHAPLRLFTGERLVLQRNSRGVLQYRDRQNEAIPTDPHHLSIVIRPATQPQTKASLRRVWGFMLCQLFARRGAEATITASHLTTTTADGVHPLRPANSRELRRPLMLSWAARKPGTSYTVTVYDHGKPLWVCKPTHATHLQYPAGAPQLLPGHRYEWDLNAELAGTHVVSPRVWFELLDEAGVSRVAADLAALDHSPNIPTDPLARHLARATLLAAEGLRAEAALEANEAQLLRPLDENLRRTLERLLATSA
ncbi:MAG: hypothetical protein ABFE08_21085 [Armatimonadia bacterium]